MNSTGRKIRWAMTDSTVNPPPKPPTPADGSLMIEGRAIKIYDPESNAIYQAERWHAIEVEEEAYRNNR